MTEIISIKDLCASFSSELPPDEYAANLAWLTQLHGMLKEDGIWVSPELGTVYKRSGAGFLEAGLFGATIRDLN